MRRSLVLAPLFLLLMQALSAQTDARIVRVLAGEPGVVAAEGETVTVATSAIKTLEANSPALLSRGRLTASGSVLSALRSVGALIEGRNALSLNDSALVSLREGVRFALGGGAEPGTASASLTVEGGSLTALSGPLIEAFSTRAIVTLKQVSLLHPDGPLVRVGDDTMVTLNAENQALDGNLEVASSGILRVFLRSGSTWTGAADAERTATDLNVTLESGSVWTLSADSRVSALRIEGGTPASVSRSIVTAGHTLRYRSSDNNWLGGRTVVLPDGGALQPY